MNTYLPVVLTFKTVQYRESTTATGERNFLTSDKKYTDSNTTQISAEKLRDTRDDRKK